MLNARNYIENIYAFIFKFYISELRYNTQFLNNFETADIMVLKTNSERKREHKETTLQDKTAIPMLT